MTLRIAVVSDIHSNIYALDAVLGDIAKRDVTKIVNLGDILYGPIQPKLTYERLLTVECVTIKGNQDRQIFQAMRDDVSTNPTLQFILDDLGAEPLHWMKQLPATQVLNDKIHLSHGIPSSDLIYWLERVSSGKPELRDQKELAELKGDIDAEVFLCGHSHIPRTVRLDSGQIIVNPGSVGLQAYYDDEPVPHKMENYSPHARYCIIEATPGCRVDHIEVPYDWQRAADDASRRGRDDWAHSLLTGRAAT